MTDELKQSELCHLSYNSRNMVGFGWMECPCSTCNPLSFHQWSPLQCQGTVPPGVAEKDVEVPVDLMRVWDLGMEPLLQHTH